MEAICTFHTHELSSPSLKIWFASCILPFPSQAQYNTMLFPIILFVANRNQRHDPNRDLVSRVRDLLRGGHNIGEGWDIFSGVRGGMVRSGLFGNWASWAHIWGAMCNKI